MTWKKLSGPRTQSLQWARERKGGRRQSCQGRERGSSAPGPREVKAAKQPDQVGVAPGYKTGHGWKSSGTSDGAGSDVGGCLFTSLEGRGQEPGSVLSGSRAGTERDAEGAGEQRDKREERRGKELQKSKGKWERGSGGGGGGERGDEGGEEALRREGGSPERRAGSSIRRRGAGRGA